ncbi:MAG: metalloregulator ArsR/SmtB family transcription factor [Gammaproteobacteria bacterium]|nr:metalloregulator ArsR/SmtB family transcription factor [Gammaproteobacteria bacterium]MCW8922780.1 metalloregulator ArsR/SmtB family transcription factor [Gammaproteobacteria bacterium]
MSSKGVKQLLFEQFARVGKAMSNANRLEILEFLAQSECNVEELSKLAGITVANTSQHLQQLRQAGLVSSRKQGLKVYYSLSGDDVIELLSIQRKVAERHIAEVDQLIDNFLTVKDSLEPLPREELLSRVKQGLVTIIDVRPAFEYDAGHVPGAINMPLDKLDDQLADFDSDTEIVAYCRGPHCVLAYDAVEKLRKQGLKASRLEDGFPEWKIAGLPVEKTNSKLNS